MKMKETEELKSRVNGYELQGGKEQQGGKELQGGRESESELRKVKTVL